MSIFKALALVVVFILAGCVHSNGATTKATIHPDVNYEFLGIPPLFAGYGTSVPISPDLSLTAAHVAAISHNKVIAYHPHCDIALIESDNRESNILELGRVNQGERVTTFGVDSGGDILTSEGFYHLDLRFVNYKKYALCPSSITDAAIQGGMSGGAAINDDGELVGILTAIANKNDTRLTSGEKLDIDRLSIFISTAYIEPWLEMEMSLYYQRDDIAIAGQVAPVKQGQRK